MRYVSLPSTTWASGIKAAALLALILLSAILSAPTVATTINVHDGDVAWGDYDSDGDLDLLVTGIGDSEPTTKLYRNDGASAFTEASATLPALGYSSAAWGDYDRDGDLDLVLMGNDSTGLCKTILLCNDSGSFAEVANSFVSLVSGELQWCDYDNDGDPDLSVSGMQDAGMGILKLYANDGTGKFSEVYSLPGRDKTIGIAWGDLTNDGKLDFVYNCRTLFRNTGSGFAVTFISQDGSGAAACLDYDVDGRLDLAVSGTATRLLHNNGSGVFAAKPPIDMLPADRMAWGDHDGDGDLDLYAIFDSSPYDSLRIYRNDGDGAFSTVMDLGATYWGDMAPADFDGDGDFDLATLVGIYRNDMGAFATVSVGNGGTAVAVSAPSAPTGLSSSIAGNDVILSWTAIPGLTYNVRVGTTPGASDVMSGMALSDGKRLIPALGNAGTSGSWRITLPLGDHYWSVQAINGGFQGSPWASESSLHVAPVSLSQAKQLADGATATIADEVVTAVFGNSFYVEAEDRSHGLRVDNPTAPGVSVGDKVEVGGVMRTDTATERYLQAKSIEKGDTGRIDPLGMPVKALGGSAFGVQGGIEGAAGLNNIGLLVTVCGRYGWSDAWGAATIDDGSGDPVKCVLPAGVGYDSNWLIVKATGISSCFKDSDGKIRRLLKIRDRDSLVLLKGAPCTISGKVFNTGGQYTQYPWFRQTAHPIPQWPSHPFEDTVVGPPNALRVRLHFSRLQMGPWEYLYLLDGQDHIRGYYQNVDYPDGYWSAWCEGNVIKVDVYTSGTFHSESWGFATDVYECEFDNPLVGVTITLQPGGRTVVTSADGRYSFTDLQAGTYTITPSYPGATFGPADATVTLTPGQIAADTNFTRQ